MGCSKQTSSIPDLDLAKFSSGLADAIYPSLPVFLNRILVFLGVSLNSWQYKCESEKIQAS